MTVRVLFLGFHHALGDPRLFHREMRAIRAYRCDAELFFMTAHDLYELPRCPGTNEPVAQVVEPQRQYAYASHLAAAPKRSQWPRRLSRPLRALWRIAMVRKLQPTVIQASDARELAWAVLLRVVTGAALVYDAHEDYFNQIYEYSGKSLGSLVRASAFSLIELLCLRLFRSVFCTDEYLIQKYSHRIFGCREVELLRNFPYVDAMPVLHSYDAKTVLDLVYIGGVNRYRGVIDCAEYVSRFNAEHRPHRALTFTVYSSPSPIVQDLLRRRMIRHVPRIDYAQLMKELTGYDVGICLLHPLRKFERNLPLKNFDYMAVGLPIVTSNFGNLERYARESGCALCIDPLDYRAFEAAVLQLFDPERRRILGQNGVTYTRSCASFESESACYVEVMTAASVEASGMQNRSLDAGSSCLQIRMLGRSSPGARSREAGPRADTSCRGSAPGVGASRRRGD